MRASFLRELLLQLSTRLPLRDLKTMITGCQKSHDQQLKMATKWTFILLLVNLMRQDLS